MTIENRPLSPHLTIYRPQITSILSVFHRGTGVMLAIGALLLTYWLVAAAYGPEAFATAQWLMGSWIGLLVLLGFTFCLFYHLCNGIRHMFWDIGYGFEMGNLTLSGIAVVVISGGLTVLTWVAAFVVKGGF